ncbi:MAG: ABC transporter ATP-binding protein, partial [Coprobacillaceae bacterium]
DEIDSGSIIFDGKKLSTLKEKELSDIRRKEMGFVFQQPTLIKNLNVLDNIILPSMRDNKKNSTKIIKRAQTLMQETGISELETRNITEVSGGQLQRVGICRALMNEPKIIFGDEPTGALNSKSSKEIMQLLLTINNGGTTIVLVTHDANVAAFASRVVFMGDGNIIDEINFSKLEDIKKLDNRVIQVTKKMQEIGI